MTSHRSIREGDYVIISAPGKPGAKYVILTIDQTNIYIHPEKDPSKTSLIVPDHSQNVPGASSETGVPTSEIGWKVHGTDFKFEVRFEHKNSDISMSQLPGDPRLHDYVIVTFSDGATEKYEIDKVTPTHLIITSVDDDSIVKIVTRKDKWIISDLPGFGTTVPTQDYKISIQPRKIDIKSIGGSFFFGDILKELQEKTDVNNYTEANDILATYQRNLLAEAISVPEGSFFEFYAYPMEDKTKEERFDFLNWLQYHNTILGVELLFNAYISENKEMIYDVIEWMIQYEIPLDGSSPSEIVEILGEPLHGSFSDDDVDLFRALGGIPNFYEIALGVTRDDVPHEFQKLVEKYPSSEKIKLELSPTTKAVLKF